MYKMENSILELRGYKGCTNLSSFQILNEVKNVLI